MSGQTDPENVHGKPKRSHRPSAKGPASYAPIAETGVVWEVYDGVLSPFSVDKYGIKTKAAWAPQPGSQVAFMACPIEEILLEGNRGGGKTDVLVAKFCKYVGKGFGPA